MSMTPPVEAPVQPPKRSNSALIIAVVLGGSALACLVLIAVVGAILFPIFAQARRTAQRTSAVSQMKMLALGNLIYANDFDQRLPIATAWMDAVSPEVSSQRAFHSPGIGRGGLGQRSYYGIAFMKSLSSVQIQGIDTPAQRVLLFDSTLMGRNATSGLDTVPKPPRFGNAETGGNVFAFVDGHVKLITATDEVNLK